MQPENELTAYILSGGKSRRFGSDKALAFMDGQPWIIHLAQAMTPSVSRIVVVADKQDKYADLGLRTVADLTPGLGPLGGLQTAVHHHVKQNGAGWFLLCSCDLIHWHDPWLVALTQHVRTGIHAVAFKKDHWYPMPGLYHTNLRLRIDQHLRRGRRALWTLLDAAPHAAVGLTADLPPIVQANTPEQLDQHSGSHSEDR